MPQLKERTAKTKFTNRPTPKSELRELADRYLTWMVATRYAEDTVKGAASNLSWLLRYLEGQGIDRIADVTTEILEDYSLCLRKQRNTRHEDRKISLAQVLHRLFTAKQFFGWLLERMVILINPAEDLELPRLPATLPQTILTQKEAQRLMDAPELKSPVGYRDKALLEVLYSTGIRVSELFRLKVSDFDPKSRTLFVREGKGGKDRILPLPMIAAGYLKEYIERVRPRFVKTLKHDAGIVFLTYTGCSLNINKMTEIFKRTTKAAGIDKHVTAMILRHSIASHLLENGMDIRYIQEFMGHEKLSTTQIYSRVTLDGLRKMYNKAHPKEKRHRGV
ncbi:MAG: tyrosine-type recombinase/integrase [Elusimicrobia bacterium]|nr:tyrosine-type recombinase/integrase [Elusimicrobiota bacterium]